MRYASILITEFNHRIAVMQAYLEGEQVEIYDPDLNRWAAKAIDNWDWDQFQYRIKPKPREFWVNTYPDGLTTIYTSEESAKINRTRQGTTIKVREIK